MDETLLALSSHAGDAGDAVAEIAAGIGDRALAGGLLFCSNRFDRSELARAIAAHMPAIPLVGCSSAGELTARGYDSDSLLFIGFPAEDFSLAALRFTDLDRIDVPAAQGAIRQLVATERHAHGGRDAPLHQVALVFVDGLSHREEVLTMTVQDALGEIQLIGGSSGDGLAFRETGVLHEGVFLRDAAVIALLSSRRPMHVFWSNHYAPGPAKMVITEADPESRTVYEINSAPAAAEYRRLIGMPEGPLDAHVFAAHPPMVRIGGKYHVRSIQSVNADCSLTFYCAIDTGIVLTIGEPIERIESMERLIGEVTGHVGAIDHVIGFDCVLNRLDAEQRQLTQDVSRFYEKHRILGFNTYGEQFHSVHMNQTFSGLAIGRYRSVA